jgi:hypothetical protein
VAAGRALKQISKLVKPEQALVVTNFQCGPGLSAYLAQHRFSPQNRSADPAEGGRLLQLLQANWSGPDGKPHDALLFNRRLWTIFVSAAESSENPQPLEVRQSIEPMVPANFAGTDTPRYGFLQRG